MLKPYFHPNRIEAGCDEAGRGCLAGPVFAAAVILPSKILRLHRWWQGVKDSKKLTHAQRNELRKRIEDHAAGFAVASATVEEIDRLNILNASILAMHRAIANLPIQPSLLLIDGNRFHPYQTLAGEFIEYRCLPQGDARYLAIACASILAKTYRDEYMYQLHEQYPQYNWKQNKGYATRYHRLAIQQYGICPQHRKSFTIFVEQMKLEFI